MMYRKLYHNKNCYWPYARWQVQIETGIVVLPFSVIYMYAHPTSYAMGGRGDPSVGKYECNLPYVT